MSLDLKKETSDLGIFIESLKATKLIDPSMEFQRYLKKEKRDEMLNYVLAALSSDDIFESLPINQKKKIAESTQLQEQLKNIASLKPGKGLRFAKEETGLDRTFYVQRDEDTGEFYLIPATMTKLAEHTPAKPVKADRSEVAQGSFKKGKLGFIINKMINGKEQQIFSLVVSKNIEKVEKEIQNSAGLNPKYIDKVIVGPAYTDKHGSKKRMVFSLEKATGSLYQLIDAHNKSGTELSKENQDKIISDLLLGVQEIRKHNLTHQDIKPQNILCFGNESAKISDFGLATKDRIGGIAGTSTYQSPEIAMHFMNKAKPGTKEHDTWVTNSPIGKVAYSLMDDASKKEISLKEASIPHQANDMWALGITIYQLKHKGGLPNFKEPAVLKEINSDPLLKGLLSFSRKNRIDINEAIVIHSLQTGKITDQQRLEKVIQIDQSTQDKSTVFGSIQKYLPEEFRKNNKQTLKAEELEIEKNALQARLEENRKNLEKARSELKPLADAIQKNELVIKGHQEELEKMKKEVQELEAQEKIREQSQSGILSKLFGLLSAPKQQSSIDADGERMRFLTNTLMRFEFIESYIIRDRQKQKELLETILNSEKEEKMFQSQLSTLNAEQAKLVPEIIEQCGIYVSQKRESTPDQAFIPQRQMETKRRKEEQEKQEQEIEQEKAEREKVSLR